MSAIAQVERRVGETTRRFFSPAARLDRPGLTGLRALAALLVLAFHLNAFTRPERITLGAGALAVDLTPIVTIGWVGVNLFFVLSGFLIAAHLARRLSEAPLEAFRARYFRDRILRVVPAYWAQVAVLFAIAWIAAGSPPDWARHVPAHLAFLQNLQMGPHAAINGIYWSLPVEFAFYLVAPAIVWAAWPRTGDVGAAARRAVLVAGAGIAISVAWRAAAVHVAVPGDVPALFWLSAAHLPGALEQFLAGMAAAMVFLARGAPDATLERRWERPSDALVAGGLAALVALMYLLDARVDRYWAPTPLFLAWHSGAGLAVAALVAGVAMRGPLARALFENRAALWLGFVSYSLYLWHPLVAAQVAVRVDAASGGLAAFALVAVPPILLVSALSAYLVERPFMRRRRETAPGPATIQ